MIQGLYSEQNAWKALRNLATISACYLDDPEGLGYKLLDDAIHEAEQVLAEQ